jgi:hypothetical protein
VESIPENIAALLDLLKDTAGKDSERQNQFSLSNGQVARVSFDLDYDNGYRRAIVATKTPRVEQAIIAALVALRGSEVRPERVRRSIMAAQWTKESMHARAAGSPLPDKPRELAQAKARDVEAGYRLDYARTLLAHYRPGFDDMPENDQIALVTRVVEHTNVLLEALRKLSACLEYGDPYAGLPNTPVKMAARDVQAAELRHIEGLTYTQIGVRLGIPQSKYDEDRNDNYRVRTQLVPNGEDILRRALGEEGFQRHVQSNRAEKEQWTSLSEPQQIAELCSELFGWPAEKAHRIIEEFARETADASDNQS